MTEEPNQRLTEEVRQVADEMIELLDGLVLTDENGQPDTQLKVITPEELWKLLGVED